jgi:hypothetical protein
MALRDESGLAAMTVRLVDKGTTYGHLGYRR